MAELIGNSKAIWPLIGFFRDTKIGGREGVNERSREWEIRVDKEGAKGLENAAE